MLWDVTDLPERDIHTDGGRLDEIEEQLNDEKCRWDDSDDHMMPRT